MGEHGEKDTLARVPASGSRLVSTASCCCNAHEVKLAPDAFPPGHTSDHCMRTAFATYRDADEAMLRWSGVPEEKIAAWLGPKAGDGNAVASQDGAS